MHVHYHMVNACSGTVLEPDQIPGSRVPGTTELPGSGTGNRGKPTAEFTNNEARNSKYALTLIVNEVLSLLMNGLYEAF